MTWIADQASRRTYDPDSEMELFVDGTGSSQIGFFRLEGPNGKCCFRAWEVFPELSDSEKRELNVSPDETASVWQIHGGSEQWHYNIKQAMLAFKSSSGFHYPGAKYFVQFGDRGKLEDA